MSEAQSESSWVVERRNVPDAMTKVHARRRILSLYPQPALFETGESSQAVDGNQTLFMVDLLFELKLIDGNWHVHTCGPFEGDVNTYRAIVNDMTQTLWERLRQVMRCLALPDGYPLVLLLGYSAARFIENLPDMDIEEGIPEVLFRVYRYTIRYDDAQNGALIDILKFSPNDVSNVATLLDALTKNESSPPVKDWDLGCIRDLTEKSVFSAAVERAKEYIRAGDIYQVQLCRRAVLSATIPPIDLYERLASINPAPYMYYLDIGNQHIVSSSPELMIRVQDGVAQVRPIAGTMRQKDQRGESLNNIPKEAAEHLMLVDLARNDLARCAIPGGVAVTSFMQVTSYGPLLHLVSTIETKIRTGCDIWDLIIANFPAGTMTGAPKVRAMEIISELEGAPRGLYTGCAGYITGLNSGVFALTIRTIIGNPGRYILQSAAGIVTDSQAAAEWDETGAKIDSFSRTMVVNA
ncbi:MULTISPECIES: anthranilate synthase component I family protein [unclassified Brenneria]|uniref:anthranilate synthase component I family protein n=1 Tax=unclassified Brenneria TaxID=2634434 RepID=UPI001553A905|nr:MULTISPECIES: anthranilate synthase component I family protein [unclassified Brenneria]MEE3645151.1 anthranilate synthase component I family protein [Brenneria sp. L3_3C_1]MEE3652787.1 anthranilate synthase component I family protein [Brenneria sp. HEZEL_4_2_4]MBJ7223906.1 anthranilate synthase component I family protein [Brenneria sp. L3-3C-1]MEE3652798.1 anthranilate synthase component I family protein [Brenneria sp. HEZEL_4_2_4]NPD02742.1 anthranilate synthase component I family protein 